VFSLLQDELNNKLRGMLLEVFSIESIKLFIEFDSIVLVEMPSDKDEPEFFAKMRNMYKSCMNLGEFIIKSLSFYL
jgi:hypothetical protein